MYWVLCFTTLCFLVVGEVVAGQGSKFLLVFQPTYGLNTDGVCQIIINTDSMAQVTISTLDFTDVIDVHVGSYIYNTSCTIRAPTGYGEKGVIVESDVDISVQVYNDRFQFGDAYLALPALSVSAEYIIATPPEPRTTSHVDCLFAIVAEYDDTHIKLYAPSPGGYEVVETITLDRLGTYVRNSHQPYIEYTGYKIASEQPISVLSGSSFFQVNNAEKCSIQPSAGFIFAPSTAQAGNEFVVPKILNQYPNNSGKYIRVISFSQSNLIELPEEGIVHVLNAGEFYQHYTEIWDDITRIECTEQCIVIIFNDVWCDYPVSGEGGFVMYVTPLERRTDYVRFTAVERSDTEYMESYLTIISETPDVMLDDGVVTGWRAVPEWEYFEAAVPIEHGGHVLESVDGGKFVAFVYGHEIDSPFGYGTAIVHDTSNALNQHCRRLLKQST